MWKLKIAEEGNPWLNSLNDHVGRQFWEFDPKLGSTEELAEVNDAWQTFHENWFVKKHSSDLLMRIQVTKESGGISREGNKIHTRICHSPHNDVSF